MSDLTKLSDDELMAALGQAKPAPAGLAAMSDADLLKALGQPAAAQPEKPSVAGDVVQSFGSGILKGAIGLAGLPGDVAGIIGRGADTAAEWLTGEKVPERIKENAPARVLGSQSLRKGFEGVTGAPLYEPQTTAGKFAGTVGEFLPATGGGVANAIRYGVLPGVASEAAGQATEGTPAEPVARVAAALAAGTLPGLARKAVTPLPISPERQKIVDVMAKEGIPLTAGQKTGSVPLRYAESIFGDSPGAGRVAGAMMERQAEAFTDAAMRRAGSSGRATPENMTAMADRIGDEFARLSARNTLQQDAQFGADIRQALREYDLVLPTEQRSIVGRLVDDIDTRFVQGRGLMPGQEYQTTRSRLSRMAQKNRQNDPEFADAVRGIRNALDSAMMRSISPDDAAAWETARQQYGAMKVLERAASGAGENAAQGLISPSQLRNATAMRDRGAYVRGEGDFAELARAGEATMKPLPNSGTGQRVNWSQIVGAGAGGATGGYLGAIAGAAAPGMAGRVIFSTPAQAWLGNQALAPAYTPGLERVTRALLTARSASTPTNAR